MRRSGAAGKWRSQPPPSRHRHDPRPAGRTRLDAPQMRKPAAGLQTGVGAMCAATGASAARRAPWRHAGEPRDGARRSSSRNALRPSPPATGPNRRAKSPSQITEPGRPGPAIGRMATMGGKSAPQGHGIAFSRRVARADRSIGPVVGRLAIFGAGTGGTGRGRRRLPRRGRRCTPWRAALADRPARRGLAAAGLGALALSSGGRRRGRRRPGGSARSRRSRRERRGSAPRT